MKKKKPSKQPRKSFQFFSKEEDTKPKGIWGVFVFIWEVVSSIFR